MELRYRALLMEALYKGYHRDDRTGVGCNSLFAKTIEFDTEGGKYWPLVCGKKMYKKIWNTEFEWFVNGETDDKRFKKNGVTIWDAWMRNGTIGKGYGYQLRSFGGETDQLEDVIEQIRENPDSRRHLISLWNPNEINETTLPPCHYSFQFFVENGSLHILINMRSTDLFLGLPYDLMMYNEVLNYVGLMAGFKPGKIKFMMADAHVYDNHKDAIREYLMTPVLDKIKYDELYEGVKVIKAPVAI